MMQMSLEVVTGTAMMAWWWGAQSVMNTAMHGIKDFLTPLSLVMPNGAVNCGGATGRHTSRLTSVGVLAAVVGRTLRTPRKVGVDPRKTRSKCWGREGL